MKYIKLAGQVGVMSLFAVGGYVNAGQFNIPYGSGTGTWTQSKEKLVKYKITVSNSPVKDNSKDPSLLTLKFYNLMKSGTMRDVTVYLDEVVGTNPAGESVFVSCHPSNDCHTRSTPIAVPFGDIRAGQSATATKYISYKDKEPILVLTFPKFQPPAAVEQESEASQNVIQPPNWNFRVDPLVRFELRFGSNYQYAWTCTDNNKLCFPSYTTAPLD